MDEHESLLDGDLDRDNGGRRNRALVDEVARLRSALRLLEWGSCDGCGNKRRCVECHRERNAWINDGQDTAPGKHAHGCPIAIALGSPMDDEST